jgi:hypothetical protein
MARIAKFSPRSRIFGFEWFESFFNKTGYELSNQNLKAILGDESQKGNF